MTFKINFWRIGMKKYNQEEKSMRLADWRQSGKSAWRYAKENGINDQTFRNWVKPKKSVQKGFVEITKPVFQLKQLNEIVIEKDRIKIHLPLSISSQDLSRIITGLQA